MHRLLTGAALAIDRRARDVLGPLGGEHRVARDVRALLADLHHTPHDHVVDDTGVDTGPIDERSERFGGEVDRVPVRQ